MQQGYVVVAVCLALFFNVVKVLYVVPAVFELYNFSTL